jgi:tetratricopeptide (TPR) repeat protein
VNDATAYAGRGSLYQGIGQYERAVQDHDEAIRLDPEHSLAYLNRALAYTYLGKDEEANRDIERAVGLGIGASLEAAAKALIEEAKSTR